LTLPKKIEEKVLVGKRSLCADSVVGSDIAGKLTIVVPLLDLPFCPLTPKNKHFSIFDYDCLLDGFTTAYITHLSILKQDTPLP
jgi:hypothetical protein